MKNMDCKNSHKQTTSKIFFSFIMALGLGLAVLTCVGWAEDDLEWLKDKYFKNNDYAGFIAKLKDLKKEDSSLSAKVSYYIALSRYNQLKYLEENQSWDEYFSKGNDYREELVSEAEKVLSLISSEQEFNLYTRLILWQFHKDQEDALKDDALKGLIDTVEEYARKKDNAEPIKKIADVVYGYGLRLEAKKIYKLYADKLLSINPKDAELKKAAQEALGQGNTSLAITLYDVYIDRIINTYDKDKLAPILMGIAKSFSYKQEGVYDAEYAEKVFQEIDAIDVSSNVWDELTLYLRAYNLEKTKLYSQSLKQYLKLIEEFPQTNYLSEALFKCGIISVYVLGDVKQGFGYFEKLATSASVNPQVISGIYQMGLLSQYQGDFDKAKEHYDRLLQLAGDGFDDTLKLTKQRLAELEKKGEIEYNLKMFLDASLKEEFNMSRVELKSNPYKLVKEKDTRISSNALLPASGCLAIEINYLWSGHIGSAEPDINQSEFITSYSYSGSKEINLLVVSPSGILDRNIDFIDIK